MKAKALAITAFLSLVLGIGLGINFNQPASIVKAPVTAAPAPVSAAPTVVLPTSAAMDAVLFESMWRAGGSSYRNAVGALSADYATRMNSHCDVQSGFSVQSAIAAYDGFVPPQSESVFAVAVKKQVKTMACEKMNGARAADILQS